VRWPDDEPRPGPVAEERGLDRRWAGGAAQGEEWRGPWMTALPVALCDAGRLWGTMGPGPA
jgi:hypothetical protein